MKGDITLKILETVGEMALESAELFAAIVVAGYGASPSRITDTQEKIHSILAQAKAKRKQETQLKQKYFNLVTKLKREGLLVQKNKGSKILFFLTGKGVEKRNTLRLYRSKTLPSPHYTQEKGTRLLIVTFDIPEKERRKRDWLRKTLQHLNLQKIQKSVWIGRIKIPKEFLEDIRMLHLTEYVEIFEVGNTGSLRHVA